MDKTCLIKNNDSKNCPMKKRLNGKNVKFKKRQMDKSRMEQMSNGKNIEWKKR
jgi:hypothetical protein